MKKKSSLVIFLVVMLLLVSLISVASSQTVKTNIMYTKVNAAPSKPTVNIINPEQDEQITFGTYRITILAVDSNGIKAVQLKIDGPESTNGWVDISANVNPDDQYYYDWKVSTEGSYSISVRATNVANRKADDSVGVMVTPTAPDPDFTLDASPNALTIVLSSSDTATITVASLNMFSDPVDLTVSGQPADVVDVTFTPAQVNPPADGSVTSTMTVAVDGSATTGTYTLTVIGESGSLTHSIEVGLEITAPPSFYTLTVQVQDEGSTAIEGATVAVDGLSSTTDVSGTTDFLDLEEGTYTVTASKTGYTSASDTVVLDSDKTATLTLTTASDFDYELFIEIDYIQGHEPTAEVLAYIEGYYMGNNPSGDLISVTFIVDDTIPYIDDYAGINDNEFSNIEAQYNDHDNGYYSNWKWVLYGTTVEGEPNVIGYCYIEAIQVGRREADILAGNYMFIADETADVWATNNGIEPYGAEAAVLMHEMGHSIGIGILKYHPLWGWYEVYDSQSQSVMATLSNENAGLYGAWYYSNEYWATRNMEYYTIA